MALIEPEETQGPGGQTSQAAAAAAGGFLYCELGAEGNMMSSSPATCE